MAKAAVGLVCLLLATAIPVERGFAQTGGFEAGFSAYAAGDYATAFAEWEPLARAGDAEAEHGLGLLYQSGRGVERNLVRAAAWFRRAASSGMARAQAELGDMYARGDGMARNMTWAVNWWRKAADQGNTRAQYGLGVAYLEGDGVAADLDAAETLLTSAAGQGYAPARAKLTEIVRLRREAGVAVSAPRPPEEPAPPPGRVAAETPAQPAGSAAAPVSSGEAVVLSLVIPGPATPPAPAMPSPAAPVPPEVPVIPPPPEMPAPGETAVAEAPAVDMTGGTAPPPVVPAVAGDAGEEKAEEGTAGEGTAGEAPSETAVPAAVAAAPAYRVHLASFREKDTAASEWRRLEAAHRDLLADLVATVRRVDLGADKGIYSRRHAGPLADAEAAQALCRALPKREVRCRVTPPA